MKLEREYPFIQRHSADAVRNPGKLWKSGKAIWGLVAAWNHATNPALLMTDREHARARLYARAIKNRMARLGMEYKKDYLELSDGSLWPIKRKE